jgi:hypothetical protein
LEHVIRAQAVLLALGLSLGFSQTVQWVDCCCGSFCRHKNSCTGCPPGSPCPGGVQGSASSCCDPHEKPETTCSHIEPSSEIDSVRVEGPTLEAAAWEALDLIPVELEPPAVSIADPREPPKRPPRAGPEGSVRRHLFISVLLI